MDTGVALMKFATGAKGIALSFDFLLRAEETTGAFGANIVTCKAKPPKYFELDKPHLRRAHLHEHAADGGHASSFTC